MGWELRQNRWYLYRNRRVNGKPVKEYVAARGEFGSLAHNLFDRNERAANERELRREANANLRAEIDEVIDNAGNANAQLKTIVEGILVAHGFRNHHRGVWRMARNNGFSNLLFPPKEPKKPTPFINFVAPDNDAEAVELFAKARTGDINAAIAVRKLIVSRNWAEHLGNLAYTATSQMIARATAGDEVWKAAVDEKIVALSNDLGGATATLLEKLLIGRVLNGWLAIHILEIQQALRPPATIKEREHLDRAISRAQKRYTEAITSLARIRRLNMPLVLAQVNVIGNVEIAK